MMKNRIYSKQNVIIIYRRINIYFDSHLETKEIEMVHKNGNPFVYLILRKADDIAYM